MGVQQVGGADLFDVEEIILCRHLAERHNLDTVGLPVRRLEEQVFKVPHAFRVAHRFAQRLNIGIVLRCVGDIHDIARVCAVLIILAAEQRGGLVQPRGVERRQIFRHPIQLLIDIRLQQVKNAVGRERVRLSERLHEPVNARVNAAPGVFGRGGLQLQQLAGHAETLF